MQRSRGAWPVDAPPTDSEHGGNARTDEEVSMTESPAKPVFSRPPDDEANLAAWADSFPRAILGDPTKHSKDDL